jgi:hypothetical protein
MDVTESDLIDPSSEDESDVGDAAAEKLGSAVVTGTDWTTETILSQLGKGNIELSPRFQRRDAWTPVRKSRFIESLFVGLPVPQIVLAERASARGRFLVLDGKQRLLTLLQFAGLAVSPNGAPAPALKLEKLVLRSDLNGLSLSDIEKNAALADALAEFQNRTIRTAVVRSWPTEAFLYLVFLRLNSETVPLSPQELRQALHPGPFADFLDEFSIDCAPLQRALHIDQPDFRMRDVEVLLRFFAYDYFLDEYSGNVKLFMDSTVAVLNAQWAYDEALIRERANACVAAIEVTLSIFDEVAFATFTKGKFERRFNRAVFDVMVSYFKDPTVAEAAKVASKAVRQAFQDLCTNDDAFLRSLQTTTKSVDATRLRIERWGLALGQVLGINIPIPIVS